MTNEEIIKSIANWYELPVEQVALLWSAFQWVSGSDLQQVVRATVTQFIKDKLV
jgi:hypothetical protein